MKRLFTIISMMIIASFAISSIVFAEKRVSTKTLKEDCVKKELLARREAHKEHLALRKLELRVREKERIEAHKERLVLREQELRVREKALKERLASRELELRAREKERKEQHARREQGLNERREFLASNDMMAQSEYKRDISKEFSVSSSPSLSITNDFGNINIIEGADDKIIFKITITGKGKNKDAAKEYAESVNVDFKQNGNSISAKTAFGRIKCNNCGRTVDYEVTVPKRTKQSIENKFGDVNINNASEPVDIKVEFGKIYANILSQADINVKHGGSTINKCEIMTINSGFSQNKFGEVGSMIGSVAHGGIDVGELGSANMKSEFSNINIQRLRNSFNTKTFSHGSLTISKLDYNFSNIAVDAKFSKIRISVDENHNFKATLYSDFGSIDTGKSIFYEKTLEKKGVVVGIIGKIKETSSSIEISSSHGNIELD